MSEQAVNAALGAMASSASALSNLAAPAIEGKTSYKYTKKLLAEQFKYSQKAFDMENQRQDYLINNSVKLQRDALRNAGYSTADPNGTGVTAASPSNVATPSPSTINTPMSGFDLGRDILLGAQLRLERAQAMDLEASAKVKSAEARQKEKYADLYEVYGESEFKAAIDKMNAEQRRAVEEALLADQQRLNSIVLTDAQEEQIRTLTNIEYEKLAPTLKLIAAQTVQAEEAGKLNKAEAARAYQDIRESQQKIENLKKDYEMTDAEIAVANATLKKVQAEAAKMRWESKDAQTTWLRHEFDRLAHEQLGWKWRMCAEFLDTFKPFVFSFK